MNYFIEKEIEQAKYASTNIATTSTTSGCQNQDQINTMLGKGTAVCCNFPTVYYPIEQFTDKSGNLRFANFKYDDYKDIRETLVNLIVEKGYTSEMIRKVLDQIQM